MQVQREELVAVLGRFNPWWRGEIIPDLPPWRRAAFEDLRNWVASPPAPRAVFLSGARQVGKTTLVLQIIQGLLESGVPAANILYATFDDYLLKLAGADTVLEAWREREPKRDGPEYIFLDEAQFIPNHGTWVKHQVDFFKNRRIVFTGSAMPLLEAGQESGVGRWHTIRLTTLSFFEYLKLRKVALPTLPRIQNLRDIVNWSPQDLRRTAETAKPYVGHFHTYLIHGGFPQTAQMDSVTQAQKLLREDIVDKVLKRDMTAVFGVRRIVELERAFLYLCHHDGGLINISALSKELRVSNQTVSHFLDIFEASHFIYRLLPFGYGKEILRGRQKIYLADAAIAPAVRSKGRSGIEDPAALGVATEAAVLKHLFTYYYAQNVRFSYWRGKKDKEVDLVAEFGGQIVPFEVKYRSRAARSRNLEGLISFCAERHVQRGYVVTKSLEDFGPLPQIDADSAQIIRIPATLLCYWMGEMELQRSHGAD
jgi:uncharacterized protein